jgi:hypothetical protein
VIETIPGAKTMSLKAMIFIDGSWLYRGRQVLFDVLNEEAGFEIDYAGIPGLIAHAISEQIDDDIDVVRTCYFGTIPVNKSGFNPVKQRTFYDFLAMQCGYDTDIFELDFRRESASHAEDKWVNEGLAATMARYASIPGTFDLAVLVAGDGDYIPLLRTVRQMGKRVQLVTINNLGGKSVTSTMLLTSPGIMDYPPIFLDEHAKDVRLVREEKMRVCKQCGNEKMTTWAGPEFFCSECRNSRHKTVRKCDNCGAEEETTWDKAFFYCSKCRREYRDNPQGGAQHPERP